MGGTLLRPAQVIKSSIEKLTILCVAHRFIRVTATAQLRIETFEHSTLGDRSYLLIDESSRLAAVIERAGVKDLIHASDGFGGWRDTGGAVTSAR
jgi:hypothetical protein